MSSDRTYTSSEQDEARRDVEYTLRARSVNRCCESMHARAWHLQLQNGITLAKHYPDSHCILREFKTMAMLKQFTVVAPNGVRFDAANYLHLCTIPFYSTHHEGQRNA